MSFASRLKQARENAGFTQQELAKALGVTKSAIGNYENGVSSPKWDVLLKIFDILHVEPNFLYQDSFDLTKKYPVTLTPKQADLIAFFNLLNAAGQNKVIDYVKDLASTGRYISPVIWGNTCTSEEEENSSLALSRKKALELIKTASVDAIFFPEKLASDGLSEYNQEITPTAKSVTK